jgi:hypothetical protein
MPRIVRMKPFHPRYDFNTLKHGDAIEVASKASAREMFRRWRRKTGSCARLVSAIESPNRLYFLDKGPIIHRGSEPLRRDVA